MKKTQSAVTYCPRIIDRTFIDLTLYARYDRRM
jgi:hypothetical protein